MNNRSSNDMRPSGWLALISVAVPGILFYFLLIRSAVYLPIGDDYHEVLAFCNGYAALTGLGPKLLHVFTFQHNEYKLIFENAILALQYSLAGHVILRPLVFLGNAFVLFLFLVLAMMYRAPGESKTEKLVLLFPVSLLLFQLQYASTLNWAMALENIAVLAFSFLSIAMLCGKPARSLASFAWACIFMLLAICASGNGFIVGLVGLLFLIQQKLWKRLAVWLACLCGIAVVYFYRYNFNSSQSPGPKNVGSSIERLNPAYILSFMGSSLATYKSYGPSLIFGVVLCGVLVLAIKRRYYLSSPAVFYSFVFVVITAIGVSGIRSSFGIEQSLASRYRIYSNLLLIFSYMFVTESYWREWKGKSRKVATVGLSVAILFCCAFCGASDQAGYRLLTGRRQAILQAMGQWEHPSAAGASEETNSQESAIVQRQIEAGIFKPDGPVLLKSMRLGVYRPPAIPPADADDRRKIAEEGMGDVQFCSWVTRTRWPGCPV